MLFCKLRGLGRRLELDQRRGIPDNANEMHVEDFFNEAMINLNFIQDGGKSVVAVQINQEKSYSFVEFRTNEEATSALLNIYLKICCGTQKPVFLPAAISTNVLDTPHKIFFGILPATINEEQVVELLKAFGDLKAFNMVKDIQTGLSKGFAFCKYLDPTITDIVYKGIYWAKIDGLLIESANRVNDPNAALLMDQMISFTKNPDGSNRNLLQYY
ncbi:hypothetical protein HDU92_008893 [Lobulomyces angularis]|nr:hypothetical protein HDU92_008893 [Lobulomyces angularis]